jgi:aminoglycoside phosphotransferase (APT) family kinase protein
MKMHDGEVDLDAGLVGRLVAAQFPGLDGLPVRAVRSTGTVNAIFRLGDHLYARLPRLPRYARALERECQWLPKLAPHLSLQVPELLAKGRPAEAYPLSWAIYRWIPGQPYADELVEDERQASSDLAQFVTELRVPPGPEGRRRNVEPGPRLRAAPGGPDHPVLRADQPGVRRVGQAHRR